MAELPKGIILITERCPTLMLGNKAILKIVLIGERPLAVIYTDQPAKGIVGVMDFLVVREGFNE